MAATFVGLLAIYVVWKAFVEDGRFGPRVGFGPDSQIYMDAARHPVWTLDFLAARGPFLFLLLAKLCARNLRAIVVVQSVIYAGAWLLLATTVRDLVRNRGAQICAFTSILLAALAPRVVQWNVIVSTESLSVSMMCALIALALRLVSAPTRGNLVAFVVGLALFVFVRDTNALVGLAIGVGAAVLAAVRRDQWRLGAAVALAGIVSGGIALGLAGQSEPPRWYKPLHETIALRLVGDGTAEPYFVARGLPLDEHLLALKERYFIVVTRLDDGEEFAPLRRWVREEGQTTYVTFLVTHPWWTLRSPLTDVGRFLSPDLDGYTFIWKLDPPPTHDALGYVGWPRWQPLVGGWSALAAAAFLALAVRRRVPAPVLMVVGLTGALAVAGFYAAWHGDALEVDRHSLAAAAQWRIGLWIVTAFVVDAVLSQVERAKEPDLQDGQDSREAAEHGRPEPSGA